MPSLEFEHHESTPGMAIVEVSALRPHSDAEAAEWRRRLPAMLAGIVGEVPEAELELGLFTDADGMVETQLAVSANGYAAEVAIELSGALAPVAETAIRAGASRGGTEWPLIVDDRTKRLGFTSGNTTVAVTSVPWHHDEDPPARHLIEELAAMPGHGLRVRLRSLQQGAQPRWEIQLRVVTEGVQPSLRMRSALRNRFPGLKVAANQDVTPAWLQVAGADLSAVFAFPVAGAQPLAGAHMAPPSPIPVVPARCTNDDTDPGVRIGYAVTAGGRPIPVALSVSERLRHLQVLGRTGTGKSSALAGIAYALAKRGEGALIADPHGQLCDRILAELPDEARERVWVIRCGDVDNPVPLNPLAESDPVRRDIAIADICGTFQYLFDKKETGIVGPRFVERVAMALRALSAVHGTRASLLDVPLASTDDGFMGAAVTASDDDRLKAWWKTNAMEKNSNEHGQVLAWVNSKFEAFSNTAAMRAILGSGVNAIDFVDAMDDGRIILLDLSKAELGEHASRLLGFLYLGRVWEAALRRTRRDRPFTVIVDEAHTLISGALTNMLTEGRKFGLGVVIAHQYLEQLDEDLRPATSGNVATTIAFRCAVADAVEIRARFGRLVDASTLVTLPDLTAVTLRTAAAGPAYPHTLVIDHNDRVPARRRAALATHTRTVMDQTWADLVDRHRDLTAAAAGGVSNMKSIAVDRVPVQRPAKRPVRARATPPAPQPSSEPASGTGGGSFLDDWLAKRSALAEQESPADDEPMLPLDQGEDGAA